MLRRLRNYIQLLLEKIRIKIFLFFNKNSHFGSDVQIDLKTTLDIRNNILILGKNVHLRSNPRGYHAGIPFPTSILLDGSEAVCEIGDNCRINGSYIHSKKKIIIGSNTVIASGTNIIDSNGHETLSLNRTVGRDLPEEILIGSNVWIGLNSIVLKGTTVGDNSIIAAGAVVKGKFPENVLIQGNPAKIVKQLQLNENRNT